MIALLAALAVSAADLGGVRGYVLPDPAVPLAGVAMTVRGGLDREPAGRNGLAALVAESVLRTPVDGVPLRDAVGRGGGAISYLVGVRNVRFYLEAPPAALPGLAGTVAHALAQPALDDATLAAGRTALGSRIADEQNNPVLVGLEAVRAAIYRGPAALPALGTPASLATLGAREARAFFADCYRRGDATVAEVGQTGGESDRAARTLAGALPAGGGAPAAALALKPFPKEPRRIVVRRAVVAPSVVLGFAAPALGSRDFAAALVVRALLTDVFEQESATTPTVLRRAVGTVYGYDLAPALLAVWIDGARIDPTAGLGAVDVVLRNTAKRPLSAAILQRYRVRARGAWQLEAISLEERADAVLAAAALGIDPAGADAVSAAIDRVGAADVERVAKAWFRAFDVAIVAPRGGEGG